MPLQGPLQLPKRVFLEDDRTPQQNSQDHLRAYTSQDLDTLS